MSKVVNVADRLAFLAKKYNVFDNPKKKDKVFVEDDEKHITIFLTSASNNKILATLMKTLNESGRFVKEVKISIDVFSSIIAADPTNNKSHVQWFLNVFNRLMRDENIESARQFIEEDLPLANSYLILFETNKRKKRFKEICQLSSMLKHITDPSDINQFKSLPQLYDAVDPFIEKKPTEVEGLLLRYVENGEAIIPVRDRKFTVFIPKTREANVIFSTYANWCTARVGNSNFNTYVNYLKPNGEKSDIYIIINNEFFTGNSDELIQIHFESNQMKDKHNSVNVSVYEKVLCKSEALSKYFYDELIVMAKANKTKSKNNQYLDALISFGFTDSLFEIIDENVAIIEFNNRTIPKLPDMRRFKLLDSLCMIETKLSELHTSVGELTNLEILVLSDNNLVSLPSEIGKLNNLIFLNIVGNKLTSIPNEIKNLDNSNGGKLQYISCREKDLGKTMYDKLRKLLPTTTFS